jgi:hypothetical protein
MTSASPSPKKVSEFCAALDELGIDRNECAQHMEVVPRTVNRWCSGETEIPGPISHLIEAWLRLERSGVGWRPGGILIGYDSFADMRQALAVGKRFPRGIDESRIAPSRNAWMYNWREDHGEAARRDSNAKGD